MISEIIDYLRLFNFPSVCLRMVLACLMGGILGLDRERNQQAAGLRTYYVVCLGAATTVLLSQYLNFMLHTQWAAISAEVGIATDVSRLGAQVINGIGFLGAGAILVTKKHQVRGLTTAAGLWACACLGLAIGAGFYELVLWGFFLLLISLRLLPSFNVILNEKRRRREVFSVTIGSADYAPDFIKRIRNMDVTLNDYHFTEDSPFQVVIDVSLPQTNGYSDFMLELCSIKFVNSVKKQ